MKTTRCIQASLTAVVLAFGLVIGGAGAAAAKCGDAVVTAGEACDAGTPLCHGGKNLGGECNSETDCGGTNGVTTFCGCTAVGSTTPACSNGVGNRDDIPNACRSNCMPPMCGDGISDGASPNNELCDDGADNGPNAPCLGSLPDSVCASGSALIQRYWGNIAFPGFGIQRSLVQCTSDLDCTNIPTCLVTGDGSLVSPALTGTTICLASGPAVNGSCTGNPQCQPNRCGDEFQCTDADCLGGPPDIGALIVNGLGALKFGPEACDDGNTDSADGCSNPNYSAPFGTAAIPFQCAQPQCGDSITTMGTEECDAGIALCIGGAKSGKACTTNNDCKGAGGGFPNGICQGSSLSASPLAGTVGLYGTNNRDDLSNSINYGTGAPCSPDGSLTSACVAVCRSSCTIATCGDGVSDTGVGEGCDDGNSFNGPGDYCVAEKRCVGGENGCLGDASGRMCADLSDVTIPGTSVAAAQCTSDDDCIKGVCGMLTCRQNSCGDGIVAANEMCDDGNTAVANNNGDTCGADVVTAGIVALTLGCDTDVAENVPGACPQGDCVLPFCGDGITQGGEMCDGGVGFCNPHTSFNALGLCSKASDCKVIPGTTEIGSTANNDPCESTQQAFGGGTGSVPAEFGFRGCGGVNCTGAVCTGCVDDVRECPTLCQITQALGGKALQGLLTSGNRSDLADHCRPTCMPPSCGDGVSDSNDQCDLGSGNGDATPCLSSYACTAQDIGNPAVTACYTAPANTVKKCVAARCGDGYTCSDASCLTGPTLNPVDNTYVPNNSPEQCDDGNTLNPSATNTDTCYTSVAGAGVPNSGARCLQAYCGDNITNPNEQCDTTTMGCSNMHEDLSDPEMQADCCIDGDVVCTNKVGLLPGLISVEDAFTSLLGCRLPNLQGAAACDKQLTNQYTRIRSKVINANVALENNDVTKARRLMRMADRSIERMSRRISRVTQPGKACVSVREALTNQNANASDLASDIVSELVQNCAPFGS